MKNTFFFRIFLLETAIIIWAGCVTAPKPYPTSGVEHPFYKTVKNVKVDPKPAEVSAPVAKPAFIEAREVKTVQARAPYGGTHLNITLEATREVPEAALKHLQKQMTLVPLDFRKRPEIKPFFTEHGKLQKGQPELRLPKIEGRNGELLTVRVPDGWEMVRPSVLRLRPDYLKMVVPTGQDGAIGVNRAALTGNWQGVRGVLQIRPAGEATPRPLAFVQVIINSRSIQTDATGAFFIDGDFTNVDLLTVGFEGRVPPRPGLTEGPRISVMNDWHNTRSQEVDIPTGTTTDGVLNIGTLVLTSLDAELFEIGSWVLQEFHELTGRFPPAPEGFRIKRWAGVHTGTPYTYYDYVVIALSFRTDYPGYQHRRNTIAHEFGHSIRHAADGDSGHWGWDNFRWAYARYHDGTEVANEQYAFNEGWANYWECSIPDFAFYCTLSYTGVPGVDFLDWNERRIGERLYDMANASGVGHDAMFEILLDNPGEIHTFREFEERYCARFPSATGFCSAGRPVRAKSECPPGYTDDGATCRLDNIIAKDSYGRGVGTLPIGCREGEPDAGLCYAPCREGYDGVGPVCWQRCPPGMQDDGAFCRRDVRIISADNSACPWYDLCGLTLARGCSTCPAGYHNDGCTCRIDAWIFAKDSYGRGVGRPFTDCGTDRVYDAGLCYEPCRSGYTGVGPVCWGTCPAGYEDHGATCYRPPHIIVKY